MDDRYRFAAELRVPLGGSSTLVAASVAAEGVALDRTTLAILDGCRAFRTLAEHAAEIRLRARVDATRAVGALTLALERGLLLSEAGCAAAGSSPAEPPRIGTVAVATRDRPAMLERALQSYLDNARRHGREVDLVVFDDSPAPATRAENSRIVRDLGGRGGPSPGYCGDEQKRTLLASLVRETGVDASILEFGLLDPEGCKHTLGANRNAALLHAAGSMLLTVDDDSVCAPAVPIGRPSSNRLVLGSEVDPADFWFFADRAEALAAVSFVARDVIAEHGSLLGRGVAELAAGAAGARRLDVEPACDHALGAVRSGLGSVLVTVSGTLGDSGTHDPAWLMAAPPGATREAFLRTESRFRSALSSREVLRVVPETTLAHGGVSITTTATGFDARDLLPPFMPVERNQDGLFGATLSRLCDGAFFGHVPWALLHDPPASRRYAPLESTVGRLRFCDVVRAIVVGSGEPLHGDRATRLRLIGARLRAAASLAPESFDDLVRGMQRSIVAGHSARLERALAACRGEPEYWARDARALLAHLRTMATSRGPALAPMASGQGGAAALRKTQRLLGRYGELCEAWPAVVEAASKLRARGEPMAA